MISIRNNGLARVAARAVRAGQGLARRAAAVLAECHYAQRRMSVLTTSPDRYAPEPDHAPDTYAEFLFRTSGTLRHEPAANWRSAGHAVR
jgi:hypothetical protein